MQASLEQWDEAVRLSEQAVHESEWSTKLPVSMLLREGAAQSLAEETALLAQREAAHAGELGRRLKAAGAMVGKLSCSLMWDDVDDLDLHCETPSGEHIFWNHKMGKCGGHLDVDMNASDKHLTSEGCENIYWKDPPRGHYKFWIENNQERGDTPTPFTVRLTKNGQVEEKTFTDLEEFEEQICFEFDLDEIRGSIDAQAELKAKQQALLAQAQDFAEDQVALKNGNFTLRLRSATVVKTEERLSKAKSKRTAAKQIALLQRKGLAQFKSEDFSSAEKTFAEAIALADANGIDTSRLGPKSEQKADSRSQAQQLVQDGVALFNSKQYQQAYVKFSEALNVCPTAGQARDWKEKALDAMSSPPQVVDTTNSAAVTKSSRMAAENMWLELDLSEAGTLQYKGFITWWQLKMSQHAKGITITDKELQQTMEVWHEFDEEGRGISREGASGVLTGMLRAGVVRMSTEGHVLPAHPHTHRARGHTGMQDVRVDIRERQFQGGMVTVSESTTTVPEP